MSPKAVFAPGLVIKELKETDGEYYLILSPELPNVMIGNSTLVEFLREFKEPSPVEPTIKKYAEKPGIDHTKDELRQYLLKTKEGGFTKRTDEELDFALERSDPEKLNRISLALNNRHDENLHSDSSTEEKLSKHELQNLIEEFASIKGDNKYLSTDLLLTGGEPFLERDRLHTVIRTASRGNLIVLIFTNGTEIDDSDIELLREVSGVTVGVGINGGTPQTHNSIQGEKVFKKATSALERLSRANIPTSMNVTIMKPNLDELKSIVSLADRLGVDNLQFNPLIIGQGEQRNAELKPDNEEILEAYHKVRELSGETECNILFMGESTKHISVDQIFKRGCSLQFGTIRIDPTGDAYPCRGLTYPDMKLGNIKSQSLQKVWKDSEILDDLYNLDINQVQECKNCELKYICNNACPAQTYKDDGDFHTPNPLCDVYHRLYWDLLIRNGEKMIE